MDSNKKVSAHKRPSFVLLNARLDGLLFWVNGREYSTLVSCCLGAKYGNLDISQCLRSAKITAIHVNDLAHAYREKMRLQLVEPMQKRSLVVCPDLWTDAYRQVSYLGITASFVDSNFRLRSADLCCSPYRDPNKFAESILAVSISYPTSSYECLLPRPCVRLFRHSVSTISIHRHLSVVADLTSPKHSSRSRPSFAWHTD